jgi:hypothetical protein
MNRIKDTAPADDQLLRDAFIELNISRRKAGMYPDGHPEIEESLSRALEVLQKVLEQKGEAALSVAKDMLFIDDRPFDQKNPVCTEFALCLSSTGIISVTFARGITTEELHAFHLFLLKDAGESSPESLEKEFNQRNLSHIKAEFIDYEAFSFAEGEPVKDNNLKRGLWHRYVHELVRGNLRSSKYPVIREIPPETFARLINAIDAAAITDEVSDRIMTAYVWQSLEKISWLADLNKLIKFINRLRPDLKKQFLTSSFSRFPKEISLTEDMLREIPADEALAFIDSINEKKTAFPEAIKNLLEKLSQLTPEGFLGRTSGREIIIDDIPLPYDVAVMSDEDDFRMFVSESYTEELHALLTAADGDAEPVQAHQSEQDWNDETLERSFNQMLLELIASSTDNHIIEHDYGYFNNLLKEQIEYFIGTGQYDQVLKILLTMRSRTGASGFQFMDLDALPPETLASLVDSFRIIGGQHREDAMALCTFCGNRIVPPLMDALTQENSRRSRKFLLDLVIHIADAAVPEAIQRLDDKRWFVKRNMLLIISESSSREALPAVRPYCYHDNLKLSFHAVKYLLKADERYGIEVLRRYLRSGTGDKMEMALNIAGVFGVKAIVPELIALLGKTAKRGSDWEQRIPMVKALGQIGDPRALSAFKNILEAKSLFFRTHLRKLKEEVFATLKNYPPEEVRMVIGTIPEEKPFISAIKFDGKPSSAVAAPGGNRAHLSASLLHNQEVPHGS